MGKYELYRNIIFDMTCVSLPYSDLIFGTMSIAVIVFILMITFVVKVLIHM